MPTYSQRERVAQVRTILARVTRRLRREAKAPGESTDFERGVKYALGAIAGALECGGLPRTAGRMTEAILEE